MNRFIVFRGNRVRSNGGVVVRGTSANVLVEANTIELSDLRCRCVCKPHYHTGRCAVCVVNNSTEPPTMAGKNYNPYVPKARD